MAGPRLSRPFLRRLASGPFSSPLYALEVPDQLPVGHRLVERLLLQPRRVQVVVDHAIAEGGPRDLRALQLAAGLHGVSSKLKAPKLYEGNAYEDATLPQVPKTMREAIAELERSKVARAAFGDRVVDHYLHTARLEQQAFDQVVTDWELARNFERI